jgi:hypothetical protein
MLLATVLLSVVSWVATQGGLQTYFSPLMSTCLAAGVQLGLLGLAWKVGSKRTWTIVTYVVVMMFSVTFSYVFFQAQMAAPVRSAGNRRSLSDSVTSSYRALADDASKALRANQEVVARLEVWLDLEETTGFTTHACIEEAVPYLNGVCNRLKARLAQWEREMGREYHEGAGRGVLHGALVGEANVARADGVALNGFVTRLSSVADRGAAVSNADRLREYEGIARQYPVELVRRYGEVNAAAPASYTLGQFDELADSREGQWQSFDDLAAAVRGTNRNGRLTWVTFFSLTMALGVDWIVLLIALGAGSDEPLLNNAFPGRTPVPGAWDPDILAQVRDWSRAAFLDPDPTLEIEETLIEDIVKAVERTDSNDDAIVVTDQKSRRFLDAAVRSGVARLTGHERHARRDQYLYMLKSCVVPSLIRYLVLRSQPSTRNPSSNEHEDRRAGTHS